MDLVNLNPKNFSLNKQQLGIGLTMPSLYRFTDTRSNMFPTASLRDALSDGTSFINNSPLGAESIRPSKVVPDRCVPIRKMGEYIMKS